MQFARLKLTPWRRRAVVFFGLLIVTAIWTSFVGSSVPVADIRSTDGSLAVKNLESLIASHEKLVRQFPGRNDLRAKYFDLLQTHMQFLGSYDSLNALRALVPASPSTVDDFLLTARFLAAIHDFAGAKSALGKASGIEPSNTQIVRQLATIRLALAQDLPGLRSEQLREVERRRDFENLTFLAAIEAELGNFEVADRLYEEALANYRDTSPFAVAFVRFEQGVMWGEKAGDEDRAFDCYRRALVHLPQYVTAQVHFSEIHFGRGNLDAALDGIQKAQHSGDPEPQGLLGEILLRKGDSTAAASAVSNAKARYDILLSGYPLAFADHGSEFFAGPGADPKRALDLALLNLANRDTERALLVAIQAAEAAGDSAKLCELAARARSRVPVSVPLKDVISAQAHCE